MRAVIAVALGAVVAAAGLASALVALPDEPVASIGTTTGGTTTVETTTEGTTTVETTTAGTTTAGTTTRDTATTAGGRGPGEDVRGPCDEAEHANDPRCTRPGAAPGDHDEDDGEDDDDRSGSNSGRS